MIEAGQPLSLDCGTHSPFRPQVVKTKKPGKPADCGTRDLMTTSLLLPSASCSLAGPADEGTAQQMLFATVFAGIGCTLQSCKRCASPPPARDS
jgi:hypothetical protein